MKVSTRQVDRSSSCSKHDENPRCKGSVTFTRDVLTHYLCHEGLEAVLSRRCADLDCRQRTRQTKDHSL